MVTLQIVRRYSKHNTWSYRQGYYQYALVKKEDRYYPLICKFNNIPVANAAFAKDIGAKWDDSEKKWVIYRDLNKK